MPPIKDILEMLGGMLAVFAIAAVIMAAIDRLGGPKQAYAAAALAFILRRRNRAGAPKGPSRV